MKEDISAFENYFGISSNPHKILNIPTKRARSKPKSASFPPYDELLQNCMGERQAANRIALKSYIMQRANPNDWWEYHDLEVYGWKLGLDILKILKIGDALQFGFDDWSEERTGKFLKPDEAYAQLLSIFLDTNTILPWGESSERYWLTQLPANMYEERLIKLSRSLRLKSSENGSNPISKGLLIEKFRTIP